MNHVFKEEQVLVVGKMFAALHTTEHRALTYHSYTHTHTSGMFNIVVTVNVHLEKTEKSYGRCNLIFFLHSSGQWCYSFIDCLLLSADLITFMSVIHSKLCLQFGISTYQLQRTIEELFSKTDAYAFILSLNKKTLFPSYHHKQLLWAIEIVHKSCFMAPVP